MLNSGIVVIIAAYNAEDTIALAIRSALLEKDVSEVVVVDDASTDNTAREANLAAANDSRFRLITQPTNQGPSAARNIAIKESSSPIVAVLDSDDIILPGRFKRMLSVKDWELIADNIVFCEDFTELKTAENILAPKPFHKDTNVILSLSAFINGNISQRGRKRGELGFIKPLLKRSFLQKHNISYQEDCRLGEDFLLYSKCLMNGARLRLIDDVGYAALIRANSLSGGHKPKDLETLWRYSRHLCAEISNDVGAKASMQNHASSILRRFQHREVLEIRRQKGLLPGVMASFSRPITIVDILQDKISKPEHQGKTPRLLFTEDEFEKMALPRQ